VPLRSSTQIHAGGAGGHLHLAGAADLRELASIDDKRGVLDWGARGADDHAGPFVDGCASGGGRLRANEGRDQDDESARTNGMVSRRMASSGKRVSGAGR